MFAVELTYEGLDVIDKNTFVGCCVLGHHDHPSLL